MQNDDRSRKGNCRQRGLSATLRMFGFVAVVALVAIGCGLIGATASTAASVGKQADSAIVSKCKADLAERLKLPAQSIKVLEVQATMWPDASLGMPEIDKAYAQVVTPGLRVVLEARSSQYLYTTSTKAYRYGGPISIWAYSMLYTMPVQDEPNLNGDLYQCSLLGTNSVRLVSEVADFYPQEKGAVIVKRRTSRSSHELLYIRADGAGTAKTLHSAFDLGEAAINEPQTKWAGFVRPTLGTTWEIAIGGIGANRAGTKTLPLPEGVRPGRIAWSGEKLAILSKKGEQMACFEISPGAAIPEWKAMASHAFPGLADFMLNKSESLEISQVTENGKPAVEVALVWFTGDRNVKAKISGLTLRGYDLLGAGLAFVWGEKDSVPAAYTVDIHTGELLPGFHGACRDIKPFRFAPRRSPITR